MTAEEVPDVALADVWHSVSLLHKHRIAHRQLRTDTVLVDDQGRSWLTGLALAELGATDRQLSVDTAELLVSLAMQVGVDRAVSSAVAGLGGPTVAAAAGFVQPLGLSGPTRAKVRKYNRARSVNLSESRAKRWLEPGGRADGLADVRAAVASATEVQPSKLEQLSRLTWKRALALLGAFVVIYVVLPQLSNLGAALHALGTADWWWFLAALPAIFVAQVFSTLLMQGTIPAELPFGPTYVVQFGGSFLNKVTPNGVWRHGSELPLPAEDRRRPGRCNRIGWLANHRQPDGQPRARRSVPHR